jgi:hypothetical protein
MNNYITISRKLFEHSLWCEERTFSRFEAWIDLIQLARFENTEQKSIINGKIVGWIRGEIPVSLRFLARRWNWSKNKVDNFFSLLENEKMIEKRTAEGTSQTIIKLSNYDSYNFSKSEKGQRRDSGGTTKGQRRDKSNIVNNVNNDDINPTDDAKHDFIDELIRIFAEKYFEIRGLEYEIMNKGKERSSAAKIFKTYKKKCPETTTDQAMNGLEKYFELCIAQTSDDWMHKNMSLSLIVSKFNEINNILRNGNQQRRTQSATTDQELAGIFAKHFTTDYRE